MAQDELKTNEIPPLEDTRELTDISGAIESYAFQGQPDTLECLLEEQKKQRNGILKSLLAITWTTLILIIVVVIVQAIARMFLPTYTVFSGRELEILSVSVFGQVIGVILAIANKLWDYRYIFDHYRSTKK